ncbi:MAG: polysaccharide pyruvyl transferase family protein [Actinomycetota bacterium]
MTSIVLAAGFWGQNIGNAFINLGGRWIVEKAFPSARVGFVQDQPGYKTFNNQRKGNPTNAFDWLANVDADVLVLQGALLTRGFPNLWRKSFDALRERRVKVVLLGVSFSTYTRVEVHRVREFLESYPPSVLVARDAPTYERIRDLVSASYLGLDSAFALSHAYAPLPMALSEPYVVLTFDHHPEPRIRGSDDERVSRPEGWWRRAFAGIGGEFDFAGSRWELSTPRLQSFLSARGIGQSYVGAALDFRRLRHQVNGYRIMRCEHRFQPYVKWKAFKRPNSMISDEPFTYCSIYSSSALTITDRVHAAVATLAYGQPTMLMNRSGRSALFARVGAADVQMRPVKVPREHLDSELAQEVEFLGNAI